MRAKLYIALSAWVTILASSHFSYAAIPAMPEAAQKAYTEKLQKLNLIGHNIGPDGKNNLATDKNATDPQDPDNQSVLDKIKNRWKAFRERYNNLYERSNGDCGKETRKSMEWLTGEKIDSTLKGGDLWKQMLKTGHWREAYPNEDYTGKIVVRSLQNNGYGHAECLVPDPNNPSQHLVSSDFRQKGSLIKSPRYFSHKDVVYIGNKG